MRLLLNKIYVVPIGIILFLLVPLMSSLSTRQLVPTVSQPQVTQEVTPKTRVNPNMQAVDISKPIIDLSGWQQPSQMDYDQLSKQIIGVIVRVQHGSTETKENIAANAKGEDTAFKSHIEAFQSRGIPVAVYAYINGTNVKEMATEAKTFYQRAKKYQPTFWWVDVEEHTMDDMNAGVEAFRSELAKQGAQNIGVYSNAWFLSSEKITTDKFQAVWLSAYGNDTGYLDAAPDTDIAYNLHQYTAAGKLNGYNGSLDMNRVTTLENYQKLFGN